MQLLTSADIQSLAIFMLKEFQKELIYQKHVNTSTLHDSLEYRIKDNGSGLHIEFWSEDYGTFVNRGRAKGTKRVPILPLIEWVIQRGIERNQKQAVRVAYAIREKIYREGIPTQGSKSISSRRQYWVDYTMQSNEGEIMKRLEFSVSRNLEKWWNDVATRFNAAA